MNESASLHELADQGLHAGLDDVGAGKGDGAKANVNESASLHELADQGLHAGLDGVGAVLA